jgi:hypothetical protein
LIVDSYSSYINIVFINKYFELRIVFLVFLLYSTYRLQPLDISFFQPLSTVYSNKLNSFISKGLGITSIKKKYFLLLFRKV